MGDFAFGQLVVLFLLLRHFLDFCVEHTHCQSYVHICRVFICLFSHFIVLFVFLQSPIPMSDGDQTNIVVYVCVFCVCVLFSGLCSVLLLSYTTAQRNTVIHVSSLIVCACCVCVCVSFCLCCLSVSLCLFVLLFSICLFVFFHTQSHNTQHLNTHTHTGTRFLCLMTQSTRQQHRQRQQAQREKNRETNTERQHTAQHPLCLVPRLSNGGCVLCVCV